MHLVCDLVVFWWFSLLYSGFCEVVVMFCFAVSVFLVGFSVGCSGLKVFEGCFVILMELFNSQCDVVSQVLRFYSAFLLLQFHF